MNVHSRDGQGDSSREQVKKQLEALSAVEPPRGLKERLVAAIPCRAVREASPSHTRRWPGATGWAGIAAMIMVMGGAFWLHNALQSSARPAPDANSYPGRVAPDFNNVRPADINALDSNTLY
jgi:hypothetical protein